MPPETESPALHGLFAPALTANGGPNARMYQVLLGSWAIESSWIGPEGLRRKSEGEWHFCPILGGLGVQDLLYGRDSTDAMRGTTLRCYDRTQDLWRITWMQPGGGEFANLTGRREGSAIVQTGTTARGGLVRWSFTEIEEKAFLWNGELSQDGGRTWELEQEMRARRLA